MPKKKKYEPKHEITKELKIKGPIAQIIDRSIDKFDSILDKMTIRDFVWLATYSMVVYYAYGVIENLDLGLIFSHPVGMVFWLMKKTLHPWIPFEEDEDEPAINYKSLALAMAAAWVIMNTTTEDILGTVKNIGKTIKGLI